MAALSAVLPAEETELINRQFQLKLREAKVLFVNETIFNQLSASEIDALKGRFFVNVIKNRKAGLVIDRQIANKSTAGSTKGSQLGAAIASAAYVDNSFSGVPSNWDYSAMGHLQSKLVGAAIGQMLGDTASSESYQFRYTIRHFDSSISYEDVFSSSSLGHSIGACLFLSKQVLLPQEVCESDPPSFRKKYLESN